MRKDYYNEYVERSFEMLKSGYSFLFDSASKVGHWKEARCTALAAMCLQLREDGRSIWLRSVRNWICENQIKGGGSKGSWGDEIWDTSMCVLALKDLEVSSKDPVIETALNWMGEIFPSNGRNNWHDEPWETSWALMAILRCGRKVQNVDIPGAIKWLSALQTAEGKIISPHYTAYFILLNEFSSKADLPHETVSLLKVTSEKCVEHLLTELERPDSDGKLWTGEAWSNGQILWALNLAKAFPLTNRLLVEKTVSWFETKQTQEGNWSDVEDTSSAILGLYAFLQELVTTDIRDSQTEKNVLDKLERRLRKAVPVPNLLIKKRLVDFDNETGYVSFNFRQKTFKWLTTILIFIFVGLIGWLANVISLIQMLWK